MRKQYFGIWFYSQLRSLLGNLKFSEHCYFYRNVFSWPNNLFSVFLALWKYLIQRQQRINNNFSDNNIIHITVLRWKYTRSLHFQLLRYRCSVNIGEGRMQKEQNVGESHCCWTASSCYLCTPHSLEWVKPIFHLQEVFRYRTRIFCLMSKRQLIFSLTW